MATNPARRDRRAAQRRQEIMAIGKGMFLSQPYAQVSMEAIAEAADLSKATLYKYFGSKLEVYSAIILSDAQHLADQIRDAFDPEDGVSANLRRMAHAYMNFFFEHPEYFEKLSWFYLPGRDQHVSATLLREVAVRVESSRAAIEECLQSGMRKGELRPLDARSAARVIYGQWLGLTYLAVATGASKGRTRGRFEALTELACNVHLEGMLADRTQVPSAAARSDTKPARSRRPSTRS